MKKPYAAPEVTEYLVIRRTVRQLRSDRQEQRAAAANLSEFVQREIDADKLPALARAVSVLAVEDRPPQTLQGLARRARVSRTTLWREWRAFGLDGVSLMALVRAALIWRVDALLGGGVDLRSALDAIGVRERTFRAALALVASTLQSPD